MADSGEYRSTLRRIMIIATLGGLLFGYDTGVVNGALPFMAAQDQLNLIFFVSTLGCSLAPSFHVMLVSRFVLGLAVGGASVTVPAYLAEISPAERRGRMVTQNELIILRHSRLSGKSALACL